MGSGNRAEMLRCLEGKTLDAGSQSPKLISIDMTE